MTQEIIESALEAMDNGEVTADDAASVAAFALETTVAILEESTIKPKTAARRVVMVLVELGLVAEADAKAAIAAVVEAMA